MIELKSFMHELERYADQTHNLKDKFEMLSEAEKEMVMEAAPASLKQPDEYFHPVYEWLENMRTNLDGKTEY
ncbi:hypothetical protein [Virgibacillus ainsalahensis]